MNNESAILILIDDIEPGEDGTAWVPLTDRPSSNCQSKLGDIVPAPPAAAHLAGVSCFDLFSPETAGSSP